MGQNSDCSGQVGGFLVLCGSKQRLQWSGWRFPCLVWVKTATAVVRLEVSLSCVGQNSDCSGQVGGFLVLCGSKQRLQWSGWRFPCLVWVKTATAVVRLEVSLSCVGQNSDCSGQVGGFLVLCGSKQRLQWSGWRFPCLVWVKTATAVVRLEVSLSCVGQNSDCSGQVGGFLVLCGSKQRLQWSGWRFPCLVWVKTATAVVRLEVSLSCVGQNSDCSGQVGGFLVLCGSKQRLQWSG